jgi:predicted nucleotide-binding protein (sugar kinase/HSP70/actin superfamily)
MGNLDISLAALMGELGVEARIPRGLSEDMVNAGKELAPEFICYPMVVLLGQMRALADQGVSLIIMVQGKGKCRLGWYAQVMEKILHRAGYPVRVMALDSPFPLKARGRQFLDTWKEIVGTPGLSTIVRAVTLTLYKQALADKSQDLLREVRAREKVRGAGDRRYRRFLRELEEAFHPVGAWLAFGRYKRDMASIPLTDEKPLKVVVAGEIYVINEPFVNRDVEKLLGSFERRIRVYRTLDVTGWLNCRIFKTPRALLEYRSTVRAAAGYLPVDVGGHGQESVGEAVRAGMCGMDGVVHLFPFTCMPEIIAQSILVKVSDDLDIPVLSMMISEQTGVAGLRTRLEAFCDFLAGRRHKSDKLLSVTGRGAEI